MALDGARYDTLLQFPAADSLRQRLAAGAPRCDLLLMTLPHASAAGAAAPCLTALLHLASQSCCPQNGRSSGLMPPNRVLVTFHSEVQRLKRLIEGHYSELLSSIAQIGMQLPSTGSPDSTSKVKGSSDAFKADDRQHSDTNADEAASAAAIKHSVQQLEALEQHCHGLSTDLLALDEFAHTAATALAKAAAGYDAAVAKSGIHSTAAPATANGGGMGKRSMHKEPVLSPVVQLTAVCSHAASAAPAAAGRDGPAAAAGQHYSASLPQDAYHQAMYQLMAEHIGPGGSTDAVLWGLSVLHARLRHRQEALQRAAAAGSAEASEAEWRAPDKFVRTTTKYWVHPSNVLRLKLACARHLPVLVYGQASPVATGDTSPEALRRQAAEATTLINSVYFDNRQCDVYHRRLRRDNDAQLVRLRWYGHPDSIGGSTACGKAGSIGSQHGDARAEGVDAAYGGGRAKEPAVFVERKTHKEPWTGTRSIKERVQLPKAPVAVAAPAAATANGHPPASELEGKERKEAVKRQLMEDVDLYLTSLGQVPVLRTEYYRTAFQAYDSNDVRISLDTDMLMIREQQLRGQLHSEHSDAAGAFGGMCGDAASLYGVSGPLGAGDVVRFPYAVLEVKLQQKTPKWIKELRRSELLVEVNGFSKFLHASALLHPDAIKASPPWFVPDAATGTMTPATLQEMADTSDKFELEAAPWLFPESSSSGSSSEAAAAANRHSATGSGISGWLRRMLPLGGAATAAQLLPAATGQLPLQQAQQGQQGVLQPQQGLQLPQQGLQLPQQGLQLPQQGLQEQQASRRQLLGRGSSDSARANDSGSPRGTPSSLISASVASSEAMQWLGQGQAQGLHAQQQQQQQPTLPGLGQRLPQQQLEAGGDKKRNPDSNGQLHAVEGNGNERHFAQQQAGLQGQPRGITDEQLLTGQQQQGQTAADAPPADASPPCSDNGNTAGGCGVHVDMTGLFKVDSTTLLLPDTIKSYEQPVAAQALWLEKDAGKAAGDVETGAAGAAGVAEAGRSSEKKGRGVVAVSRRLKTWLRRGKGAKQGPEEPNEHMTGMKGGPRANALVRTRIEPKTFFAAERTYLAWMHIAVLIMLTGLGLLTGATLVVNKNGGVDCDTGCKASQISGIIITPVAIVFMAYSLFMYKKRSIQIMRRQTVRYDDQRGPVVLTLLLIAVTAVSLALAVRQFGNPNGSPPGIGKSTGVHHPASPSPLPASPEASPGVSPLVSPFLEALGYSGAAG